MWRYVRSIWSIYQVVFGTKELAVLPIKVNISNPTQQTYLLETQRIMLMDASGKRVKPISEGETAFPRAVADRPFHWTGGQYPGLFILSVGNVYGRARVAGRPA